MIDEILLKREEKAIFALRSLYRKYGYSSFKMSKFEEYDFYARNKGYLQSENILTFTDINGKLLALKPDVTLSVIKSGDDKPGSKQKVHYDENIYRVSERTGQFREIMQVGLENIGDIDCDDICEVILLAAKSLDMISENFVMDISHLDILPALTTGIETDEDFEKSLIKCLAEKNVHGIRRVCRAYDIPEAVIGDICEFAGIYGEMSEVLARLKPLCRNAAAVRAWKELNCIYECIKASEFEDRVRFDFSVVNNMNYYNGIVFRGFIDGISEGVLAGGQYDRLMQKMRRRSKAIGFAIYMDLIEELERGKEEYSVYKIVEKDAE